VARTPKDRRADLATRQGNQPAAPDVDSAADTDAALDGDVALAVGRDEHGVHILRRRSAAAPVEAGILTPLREGKPIAGEVVSLRPRPEAPFVFDVKSEFEGTEEAPRPSGDGPAQVANDAYRRGWDAVWGGPRRRDRSVN